jgi:hypothetical protein
MSDQAGFDPGFPLARPVRPRFPVERDSSRGNVPGTAHADKPVAKIRRVNHET